MSLFRAQEWWSWTLQQHSRHDSAPQSKDEVDGTAGALVVANIDNDPSGKMKIIAGSLSGMLRMFSPRGGPRGGHTVEDMVIETDLHLPILQLLSGRFIAGTRDNFLAVLHPYSLAVYAISPVKSTESSSTTTVAAYYDLQQIHVHKFARPAYNMVSGTFGADRTSASSSDALCVQSLDGVLQFYINGAFAFHRLLPQTSFIIPGPLLYLPSTDSFITVNSEMVMESYRYSLIASSSDNVDIDPTLMTGKRLTAEWKANLGDHITWLGAARHEGG
ncbi:Protein PTHB1 [Perkinsus chesapeaki]|uniref:Protein PTHB1 n=1 Tax=Perkinsus chesapeaki TaxID=330153 RepID=A0A7J6N2P6_PERCH|nr:Protein PTHB1 [Perkinsus chesapeaki]